MRREQKLGALALCLALACGPNHGEAFLLSFRAAQRAYAAGRYDEAAQLFQTAADDARRVKDRDEALFLRARMYERLQRWDDAKEAYRRLLAVSPDGPRAGRAAFELATIEIQHGDAPKGWAALAEAIERHPSHGSASRAIELWAEHIADSEGEPALQRRLEELVRRLAGTASEQRAKYELARSFQRSANHDAAHAAFLRAARDHPIPRGNLTDDAYWFAAENAEKMGKRELAIATLEELLASREIAIGGSYERPRYPAAQMRIAELKRDLGDLAAARAAFRRTHQNHATSILADDAIWQEAIMAKRLGDAKGACAIVDELARRFESSRYVRCAGLLCPARPAERCPRYIRESLEPGD